jgi:predicted Zn-dependent protease
MALAGAVWTGAPVLSVTLAQKVPIEWETLLSRKLLSTLEPELCREPDVQAALAVLVEPLIHGEPLPYVPVIRVIRDPAVNAFALPGGLIVLNTGLLAKIKSPEALQGVIAHELQHVLQRHVVAALIRGSLFTAFWAVTVGDYSGMLAMDPASVYQLATLRFSREAETEADAAAIQMLVRAGISSEPFEEFLAKDLSGLTGLSFLSTHLLGEERRVAAKQKSQSDSNGALPPAGAGKSASGSSGAEAWTLLQSACQSLKQAGSHE